MKRGNFLAKNQQEKIFADDFKKFAHAHNPWTIWSDFINMTACVFSNVMRHAVWQEREDEYLQIMNKYKPEEQKIFPKLVADLVNALEANPCQDFLGDLYMRMEFGDDWRAQVFTPWHIAEMMARITMGDNCQKAVEKRGYLSICDPCCGSGVMLLAAAQVLKQQGINYQQSVIFVGQDIDPLVAKMCYIQMSLMGLPGYAAVGNSLTEPITSKGIYPIYPTERLYFTPLFYLFHPPKAVKNEMLPVPVQLPTVRPLPGTPTVALESVIQSILSNRRANT